PGLVWPRPAASDSPEESWPDHWIARHPMASALWCSRSQLEGSDCFISVEPARGCHRRERLWQEHADPRMFVTCSWRPVKTYPGGGLTGRELYSADRSRIY